MSDDVIIRAENIGKRYVLNHQTGGAAGQYRKFSDTLVHAAKAPLRWLQRPNSHLPSTSSQKEDFWALKDINFEIKRGEVVGIIGRNGAGKSTLLKILSRITEPTTGRIALRGRVASLLEVGTGFHPELTGRENIYLNGAILGMTKAEIRTKFDEIVAFAEIEKFLDTPVKRYSSGMYVRLAFAVAAHLEPEILIVDEVLAVGDTQFQKKCLGKMQDVARNSGRTILFVSHNLSAVRQLTERCLVLSSGTTSFDGASGAAIEYLVAASSMAHTGAYDVEDLSRYIHGTGDARFCKLWFETQSSAFPTGAQIEINAEIETKRSLQNGRFSITVRGPDSEPVCTGFGMANLGADTPGRYRLRVCVPVDHVAPGHYFCTLALSTPVEGHEKILDAITDVLHFEIYPGENCMHGPTPWNRNWGSVQMPRLNAVISHE